MHHFANRLSRRTDKLPVTGLSIIAACGDSYPDHEVRRNICLDANANTLLLAGAFESVPPQALTSRHLFTGDTEADREWRQRFDAAYWSNAPSHAILGLGILNTKHRLVMLAEQGRLANPPMSNDPRVADKVNELMELVHKQEEGGDGPAVAEVGMHLFPVPSQNGVSPDIERLTVEINQSMFAPTHDQLASVRSISIIAGTPAKSRAIRHLLTEMRAAITAGADTAKHQQALRIRYLCMDVDCAEALLAEG